MRSILMFMGLPQAMAEPLGQSDLGLGLVAEQASVELGLGFGNDAIPRGPEASRTARTATRFPTHDGCVANTEDSTLLVACAIDGVASTLAQGI